MYKPTTVSTVSGSRLASAFSLALSTAGSIPPNNCRRAFVAAFNDCLQRSEAKDVCFVLAFRREFLGQLTSEFEEQIPQLAPRKLQLVQA